MVPHHEEEGRRAEGRRAVPSSIPDGTLEMRRLLVELLLEVEDGRLPLVLLVHDDVEGKTEAERLIWRVPVGGSFPCQLRHFGGLQPTT